uniref:Uncharacterized protein n=1 Tax=Arundo donax TaxID=35708 RepID=A0A0A9HUV5_ARUDO
MLLFVDLVELRPVCSQLAHGVADRRLVLDRRRDPCVPMGEAREGPAPHDWCTPLTPNFTMHI